MNNVNSQTETINSSDKPSHPIVFLVLFLPFGIFTGYLTVTLAYLLSRSGISVEQIAGLIAINTIPQIFKFLWAPVVDATLSLKKWYAIAATVIALCLLATGIVPLEVSNLQFLTLMIIISSVALSIISAAGGSLAAHDTPGKMKGRVAGYIMAGHLGGASVGGGVGLWLSQHTASVWMAGAVLAITCILCCIALFFVNDPPSTIKVKTAKKTLDNLFKDIWSTIKTKLGILAMLLCLTPTATAAAGNLFAAVAKDWKAGADIVAVVTGITGGMVTIIGCLAGGWICDKMDRQKAYIIFGLTQAVCALGMAYCPHTPVMYILWTLGYTFVSGLEYAAFAAFVLEATGKGAAASKYELFNGISWAPIYLMIWIAGLAYAKWGANGMLNTEACFALVGTALFICARALIKKNKAATLNGVPVLSEA